MKTVLIKQGVRFLGVSYAVTGEAIPVDDDAVAEGLIRLGFAEAAPARRVDDPGGDDDHSPADHGQGNSSDDHLDPNNIQQKSLFAAPENKALPAAPENKHEEQDQ